MTKYPVTKIAQKEAGKSTLGARKIYFDEIVGRLNNDARGLLLGEFDTGDSVLLLYNDGTYQLTDFELTNHYDMKNIIHIGKYNPEQIISTVHFDGNKAWTMVKRFKVEKSKIGEKFSYLTDHKNSKLLLATVKTSSRVQYSMKIAGKKMNGELNLVEFVDVKGWKAAGNKVSDQLLTNLKEIEVSEIADLKEKQLQAGDTIDLDVNTGGQVTLF